MNGIHKLLVCLLATVALVIPLLIAGAALQSPEHPAVVRIAAEPTNTPRGHLATASVVECSRTSQREFLWLAA